MHFIAHAVSSAFPVMTINNKCPLLPSGYSDVLILFPRPSHTLLFFFFLSVFRWIICMESCLLVDS